MTHQKLDDDELHRQMEEQVAQKNEYDEWKLQLAGECHSKGIAYPAGYELLRYWNAEQKKRKAQRKKDKNVQYAKYLLNVQRKKIEQLTGLPSVEYSEEELETEALDAIDRAMARVQEQLTANKQYADRKQQELVAFSLPSPEDSYKLQSDDIGPIEGEI